MKKDLRDRERQEPLLAKRLFAALVLWSLWLTIFPVSFFSTEKGQSPEGMVYCPLSKKFQPINPPREKKNPFGDICAGAETKDFLFQEIFVKNPFQKISLDEDNLQHLAFDFLTHGKPALEKLPNLPKSPSENLVRKVSSGVTASSNFGENPVWKQAAKIFSLEFAARPPTVGESFSFFSNPIYQSKELSRRIAPRAPPVLS